MRPHRYTNVAVLGVPFPGATFGSNFTTNQYQLSGAVYGAPSLLPGWTFTRASTGYAETVAGTLTSFASGAPRITDKGLLIEEARTNYVTYSNAITGSTGVTVTSAVGSAPDGTLTAQRIAKTDATTPRYSYHTASMTAAAATSYVVSRYFKYDGYDTTVSLEYNSGPYFDLNFAATFVVTASGITASAPTLCTSGVVAMADGWYRCWAVFTSGASPVGVNSIPFLTRITGASGVTVQTWQSDLNVGAFIASPTPTTTASATRAADVLKIVATNLVPLAAGTIYFESAGPPWGNDLTDHYMLDWAATSEGLARFVSGVIQLHDGTGYRTLISYQTAGLAAKYAISYGGSAVNASLNGAAVVNATFDGSMASNAEAYIGCSTSGVFQWDAYIRKVIIYPTVFTDAQLVAASL